MAEKQPKGKQTEEEYEERDHYSNKGGHKVRSDFWKAQRKEYGSDPPKTRRAS